MTRWDHAKKQIREALTSVEDEGLEITQKPGSRGHAWGYVRCAACGDHKSVWSTPKNVDNHAKDLIRWALKHSHKER
jgi:hypothetical protein